MMNIRFFFQRLFNYNHEEPFISKGQTRKKIISSSEKIDVKAETQNKEIKLRAPELNPIQVETTPSVIPILFHHNLKRLNLYSCSINNAGMIELARILLTNYLLTALELGRNCFDDEGLTALAEALKINSSLTRLDLQYNNIHDAGIIALAIALKINTSLTRLDLRNDYLTDKGYNELANTLMVNTHLISINLDFREKYKERYYFCSKPKKKKVFNSSRYFNFRFTRIDLAR